MTDARVIGLLSWYDENPQWLRDVITSFSRCGVSHFICLDGAYFLLEGGKAASPRKQHKAIVDTCANLGVGCTIHTPESVFYGNEVEKRNLMWRLADQITGPEDWRCIIDADEVVEQPVDLRAELANVTEDVAEVMLIDRYEQDDPVVKANPGMPLELPTPLRKLFRGWGIHCDRNHYTYRDPDGRTLWGYDNGRMAPAYTATHMMKVWHRSRDRTLTRHRQQYDYYARRDKLAVEGLEGTSCKYCDSQATEVMGGNMTTTPQGYAVSDRIPVCAKHEQRVRWENAQDALAGKISVEHAAAANQGQHVQRFVTK